LHKTTKFEAVTKKPTKYWGITQKKSTGLDVAAVVTTELGSDNGSHGYVSASGASYGAARAQNHTAE
jgi:hypothetical protein